MCEILGLSADHEVKANPWLKDFYSHSSSHPHGWGLAMFYDRGAASIEKEAVNASESRYLRDRLSTEIRVSALMAHIRHATVGMLDYNNTHPFVDRDETGRCWTLVHNGTIFNGSGLEKYRFIQEGTTDSERVLCCIIDRANAAAKELGRPLSETERFRLIESIADGLSDGNKLNFILNDGDFLYVHSNYRNGLHLFSGDGYRVVATKALEKASAEAEGAAGGWKPLAINRLFVFKGSSLVFEGRDHGHEYRDSAEDFAYIAGLAACSQGRPTVSATV